MSALNTHNWNVCIEYMYMLQHADIKDDVMQKTYVNNWFML